MQKGDMFPDVLFQSPGGTMMKPCSMRGNIVLIWFTDFCDSCSPGFEPLSKLQSEFESSGLKVLIVSMVEDNYGLMERASATHNLKYPLLTGHEDALSRVHGPRYIRGSCPLNNIVLLDREGIVVLTGQFPGTPPSLLRDEVQAILQR
jgi:peroxiredoxin